MSTVQRINFEPVSDILPVQRRDFPLNDPTLADPLNSVALVDGEWATINSAYKLVRGSDVTATGDPALIKTFPVFMERGRYDVQAMAQRKTVILWRGDYEFDTRIFDASVTVGGGAPITTVMQPLKVATVVIGARKYTGLVGHGGSGDTNPVVGFVSRLPASNGGKLRFINGSRV
jgi:hypothetical protein